MNVLALFLAGLLMVVPGAGAAMAVFRPGTIALPTRLALVFCLGYVVTGGVAFVLTIGRVLSPTSFFALLIIVTAGLWVMAFRRGSLADHGRALMAEIRADPWPILGGLVVVVGIAVVAFGFSPLLNFSPSTSWRYWVDGREIAAAGRVPAASLQYGMLLPPTVSKVFLNAFDAALTYTVGTDPLRSLGPLTWLSAVGLVASLWAVGRELGLRFTAPLLPLLTVVNRIVLYKEPSVDLHTFKAETIGRMLVFAGVALGVRALKDRISWREAIVAGVLLSAASGTHLVPVVVGIVLLGLYFLVRLALDSGRVALVKQAAVLAVTAGLLAGAILLLPGGDIGFQGTAGNQEYAGFGANFDPTRYLSGGNVDQAPHRYAGPFYIAPSNILQAFVTRATRVQPGTRLGHRTLVPLEWLLALGGLAVAVGILIWFPRNLKPLGIMAWGLGAALVIGALYFSYRYDLFILAWFGVRRLYDYSALPVVLMGLALIEGGLIWVRRRIRPRAAVAAGAVIVLAAAAVFVGTARVPGENVPANILRLEALDWIRSNTPCDSRILATQRTTGIFEAMTGRIAVLEGMAPYLRPDILDDVVGLLLQARGFFEDPVDNRSFLEEQGIDYVVVLRGSLIGFRSPLGTPNVEGLRSLPELAMVYSGRTADVYQVRFPGRVGSAFVDPRGFPGYECRHGPILEQIT